MSTRLLDIPENDYDEYVLDYDAWLMKYEPEQNDTCDVDPFDEIGNAFVSAATEFKERADAICGDVDEDFNDAHNANGSFDTAGHGGDNDEGGAEDGDGDGDGDGYGDDVTNADGGDGGAEDVDGDSRELDSPCEDPWGDCCYGYDDCLNDESSGSEEKIRAYLDQVKEDTNDEAVSCEVIRRLFFPHQIAKSCLFGFYIHVARRMYYDHYYEHVDIPFVLMGSVKLDLRNNPIHSIFDAIGGYVRKFYKFALTVMNDVDRFGSENVWEFYQLKKALRVLAYYISGRKMTKEAYAEIIGVDMNEESDDDDDDFVYPPTGWRLVEKEFEDGGTFTGFRYFRRSKVITDIGTVDIIRFLTSEYLLPNSEMIGTRDAKIATYTFAVGGYTGKIVVKVGNLEAAEMFEKLADDIDAYREEMIAYAKGGEKPYWF